MQFRGELNVDFQLLDREFGFTIAAVVNHSKKGEPTKISENYIEFRGRASAWYSLLYPTMFFEIAMEGEGGLCVWFQTRIVVGNSDFCVREK